MLTTPDACGAGSFWCTGWACVCQRHEWRWRAGACSSPTPQRCATFTTPSGPPPAAPSTPSSATLFAPRPPNRRLLLDSRRPPPRVLDYTTLRPGGAPRGRQQRALPADRRAAHSGAPPAAESNPASSRPAAPSGASAAQLLQSKEQLRQRVLHLHAELST